MTGVMLVTCVAVLIGIAAVVRPVMRSRDERAETEAALERIALLYGPDVRPVLPEGRSWLHGPGRLPDGIDGAASWPLVAWIERHGRPIDGAAPSDGWGRSIALIPGISQGRPIVMLVSAGPDGFLESAPETGVRGDDVVRIIG